MKRSRDWKLVLGLVLLLLALFWWLPAAWVRPALEARLHGLRLAQLQGSLWQGHAGEVLGPDGKPLGQLSWQLSRALLWGDLRLSFDLHGADLAASGKLRGDTQEQVWDQLKLRGDAVFFARRFGLPDGYLRGVVVADIAHARMRGNWPMALDGTGQWRDGHLSTRVGSIAVGTLIMRATGDEGVVQIEVRDDGNGPLALNGQWRLSPIGWTVDIMARARSGDAAMQQWLKTLGQPDASGNVHIQRSGGVAAVIGNKGKS